MTRHTCKSLVRVSPDSLYTALCNLCRWPEWDSEIAHIKHDGSEPRPGTRFPLKPKGGPQATLVVEAAERPSKFIDVSLLPLGKIRTIHEFVAHPQGFTEVVITIKTFGPLGFLWNKLIAQKQAAGAEKQAQALVAFAKTKAG